MSILHLFQDVSDLPKLKRLRDPEPPLFEGNLLGVG